MKKILLAQLPVPKSNFGARAGNIPLAGACLAQAAHGLPDLRVDILDPVLASHGSDCLILQQIIHYAPDILGFTVYAWNLDRSLYLAEQAKKRTGCRIILGGPEITPDNPRIQNDFIDALVTGEGEQAFRQFLGSAQPSPPDTLFTHFPSPYLTGHIQALQRDPMMLETQRGCPFHCGFCRYNKARDRVVFKPERHILDGICHAVDNGIKEVFFLDPTLNARPDLEKILMDLAKLNPDHSISFSSEIRADRVTPRMAELLARAGFKEFEIGLQSTNPKALDLMGRPTSPDQFLRGCNALQDHGIRLKTDLIVGLPGDDLTGFINSLDFVMENNLDRHIQVFPLLVLPGTRFRHDSEALGLVYDPTPPYTVKRTPGFPGEDISAAFDVAEEKLDLALIPMPDLDLSWKDGSSLAGLPMIPKVILDHPMPDKALARTAARLASPYQVFTLPDLPVEFLESAVACFTRANPFTPLEIVFLEPRIPPNVLALLDKACLHRPHFLDKDLDLLHPEPGNRALLFTLVSPSGRLIFQGPMMRQAYLWNHHRLPTDQDMESLSSLDGILIDTPLPKNILETWQDQFYPKADALPLISFSAIPLQRRWQKLVSPDAYDWDLL